MDLTDLRQAAIDQLGQSSAVGNTLHQQPPADLIHELRVHQVELEMQNEELRRAQLELEDSRDRYANLFDFAPVGYLTIDSSNQIVEANLTIANLLGVERGKLIGQIVNHFVLPDDAAQLHRYLREITGATKSSCELSLQQADGNPLPVRLDSIATGDGCRSIAIADLTAKEELIRAKQDSDERLRIICHAMPIPIAYIDLAVTYQFNNAAHEQWFKVSRESIVGKSVKDIYGDIVYEVIKPCIRSVLAGRVCSCPLEIPNGDSSLRSVEVHYAPHRDDNNEVVGFYELMFDVSTDVQVAGQLARREDLELHLHELSLRQRKVFDLLIRGKSNKVIAFELDLGMRTIERERHQILKLVDVSSINELLVKFAGLVDPTDLD